MQMSKNVNNDVSKDPPIEKRNFIFDFRFSCLRFCHFRILLETRERRHFLSIIDRYQKASKPLINKMAVLENIFVRSFLIEENNI